MWCKMRGVIGGAVGNGMLAKGYLEVTTLNFITSLTFVQNTPIIAVHIFPGRARTLVSARQFCRFVILNSLLFLPPKVDLLRIYEYNHPPPLLHTGGLECS